VLNDITVQKERRDSVRFGWESIDTIEGFMPKVISFRFRTLEYQRVE